MKRMKSIPCIKLCETLRNHLEMDDLCSVMHNNIDDCTEMAHSHSFNEIIWVKESVDDTFDDCMHHIDSVVYNMKKNTILFIASGQAHRFEGDNRKYNGTVIRFSDYFFTEGAFGQGAFLKYNLFDALKKRPYSEMSDCSVIELERIEDGIRRELNREGAFGHDEFLKCLLNLFLLLVIRDGSMIRSTQVSVRDTIHRRFLQFNELLDQNYCNIHTVQGYADIMGVSSRSLSECVRSNAGCSPLELINKRIVLEAKRMLVHTNMSIKEVSSSLGFEDASYFVKFFRRCDGRTPSDLRSNS